MPKRAETTWTDHTITLQGPCNLKWTTDSDGAPGTPMPISDCHNSLFDLTTTSWNHVTLPYVAKPLSKQHIRNKSRLEFRCEVTQRKNAPTPSTSKPRPATSVATRMSYLATQYLCGTQYHLWPIFQWLMLSKINCNIWCFFRNETRWLSRGT